MRSEPRATPANGSDRMNRTEQTQSTWIPRYDGSEIIAVTAGAASGGLTIAGPVGMALGALAGFGLSMYALRKQSKRLPRLSSFQKR